MKCLSVTFLPGNPSLCKNSVISKAASTTAATAFVADSATSHGRRIPGTAWVRIVLAKAALAGMPKITIRP
jgi:hypothetical protein